MNWSLEGMSVPEICGDERVNIILSMNIYKLEK
jgi:hypothetical protein